MRCVVGQPFAAGPWFPPDTASVSTIYIVISIRERVKHPSATFLHYLSRFLVPPQFNDWSRLRGPFVRSACRGSPAGVGQRALARASIRTARAVSYADRRSGRLPVDAWTSIGRPRARDPCARRDVVDVCAPAARRRRVGARPRMTRCRCRGARGRSRAAARAAASSGPSMLPAHRPQRRLGRDLAPPGSRSDPASRPRGPTSARMPPCARPPPLRSAADPLLSGAPVPRSAVGQRPANGRVAPIGTLPRPGSPAQRPRRGDQRSMACSRCGSTAVQRPSAPCRCPLRAASTCMSASAQPGSRSAARHQRRSAPRCAFAGGSRPVRRAAVATPSAGPHRSAQGPPAGTPGPPAQFPAPARRRGPNAARVAVNWRGPSR